MFLASLEDAVFNKILLLNLVVAFSTEHQMPAALVTECREKLHSARADLEEVRSILATYDVDTKK